MSICWTHDGLTRTILLLACGVLTNSLSAADTADTPRHEFSRCLLNAKNSPDQLWKWMLENGGQYEASRDSRQSFQIEVIVDGLHGEQPDQYRFARCIADGHQRHTQLVAMGALHIPFGVYSRDRQYQLEPNGWYLADHIRWGFVANDKNPVDFLRVKEDDVPADSIGYIELNVERWLNRIMREQSNAVAWDSVSSTLTAVNKRGTKAEVSFRSPGDTEASNDPIRELLITSNIGTKICFRNFVRDPHSPLRTNLALRKAVIPIATKGVATDDRVVSYEDKNGDVAAGMKMWNVLWPLEVESPALQEAISILKSGTEKEPRMRRSFLDDPSGEQIVKRIASLIALLEHLDELMIWEPAFEAKHCVEDPAYQWRMFEQLVSPTLAQIVTEQFLLDVLAIEDMPLRMRCRFASAVANLGNSPYEIRFDRQAKEIRDRDLIEAVLLSRWRRPCEQRHINACVDYLKQSAKTDLARDCVTESLIRLHSLAEIPNECLPEWFERHVLNAENKAERWRSLVILTASKAGRDWAQARMDNTVPHTVNDSFKSVMLQRATSAQKSGRFENIAEEECRKILSAPE